MVGGKGALVAVYDMGQARTETGSTYNASGLWSKRINSIRYTQYRILRPSATNFVVGTVELLFFGIEVRRPGQQMSLKKKG